MPTFYVKYRKTSPIVVDTVEADSAEVANARVVEQVGPGETIEILASTTDASIAGAPEDGGATGATGTARRQM